MIPAVTRAILMKNDGVSVTNLELNRYTLSSYNIASILSASVRNRVLNECLESELKILLSVE